MVLNNQKPTSLGFKYPENRNAVNKGSRLWLEDKRTHDGAEGLWRVHDDIYDLTDFIDVHPGGKSWLELSKGTDVTEAFESHHIFPTAESVLKRFHVKKAATKRHAPYTFKEDGFYRTLKRNVREEVKNCRKTGARKSHFMIDSLLITTFILGVLGCKSASIFLTTMAGLALCCTGIAAHSYFHQRDNFRMYYFELTFLTVRDWRVSHVLSHHMLTNSIYDLEISLFEPFCEYLPTANKRLSSLFMLPVTCLLLFHKSIYKRIKNGKLANIKINHLIPFLLPLVMYGFSGQSIFNTFYLWNLILLIASLTSAFIGFNAGHHHPETFHDGDAVREDMDWGLYQLDAVIDRVEVNESHFLSLVTFGEHALHHLFPSLDVGTLQALHPILTKTLHDFGIDLRLISQMSMFKGQFQQLLRDKPNEQVPDLLKYSRNK